MNEPKSASKTSSIRPSRRELLGLAGRAAALGLLPLPAFRARAESPNEKLAIGIIGTTNRAEANIEGVQGEHIAALCDIDDRYLAAASQRFPGATRHHDFRKLLDEKGLDAVVISTADHTHAVAAAAALGSGRHVYCEKPLAHDVFEARALAKLARETGRATQLGTQIHAEPNYRRVVELIRAGAIGAVREVHVWVGKTWSGGERPKETPPVPPHLHFDLWLGPAPERPYHPDYLPANWRRWWDFGGGTLADMGCHHIDLPFWALGLRHPRVIEAEGPPVHPETAPLWRIVRYEFPLEGATEPLRLTWYDGGKRPPQFAEGLLPEWGDGTLFVGTKGSCLADYSRYLFLPEKDFAGFTPPPRTIPDSPGHYTEWIAAAKKGGGPTPCEFAYSGALTEAVLLGNVAYRSGKKVLWDAEKLAADSPEAQRYVRREYRKGWEMVS